MVLIVVVAAGRPLPRETEVFVDHELAADREASKANREGHDNTCRHC